MNEEEAKKWVRDKQDVIFQAVQSNAEQRKDAAKEYREYFYALITTSGVIAGAIVVLISANFPQIRFFTIISLFLQLIVIVLCFSQFRSGLKRSEKIIRYIRKIDRTYSDLSYWMTKFQRNEMDLSDFQTKWDQVYGQYDKLRSNDDIKEIDTEDEKALSKKEKIWGTSDWIFYMFMISLFSLALALILPYIYCR